MFALHCALFVLTKKLLWLFDVFIHEEENN